MATYLAKENKPQHLILVSPFRSMVAMKDIILPVAPSFLMKYPFYNDRHLLEVDCPVSLFHGTDDELIPFAHSEYLRALLPAQTQLTPLSGTGHRGAIFSRQIRTALSSLASKG
jgi:pimeloyl-ACP methyl ester carboxylesterase